MSSILLSFCIPTYNRPERITNIINQIISFQSEEIEIVIGDDNPSFEKTQEAVKKFNDPRIKYFRNRKNLGIELNLIRIFKRANGVFLFLLMDEDDIEMETIPWILKIIKKNNNLTQLCGTLGDKRPNHNKDNREFGDKLLKRGAESLKKLLFSSMHASGVVLKKKALDLNKALKYVGPLTMVAGLVGQACIAGDTLCTSKLFAYIGKVQYESCQPSINGKKYWNPLYKFETTKMQISIIYNITKGMKNGTKIRKILLSNRTRRIYNLLNRSFLISFKSFLEGIGIVISITKISKSPRFWVELLMNYLFSFFYGKFKSSHNSFFNYFIHQIVKFLDTARLTYLKEFS